MPLLLRLAEGLGEECGKIGGTFDDDHLHRIEAAPASANRTTWCLATDMGSNSIAEELCSLAPQHVRHTWRSPDIRDRGDCRNIGGFLGVACELEGVELQEEGLGHQVVLVEEAEGRDDRDVLAPLSGRRNSLDSTDVVGTAVKGEAEDGEQVGCRWRQS